MQSYLTLAALPILGAFIGYTTNYVAIRMLFRPLKPWSLFGFRVPLTPGVIPAGRAKLAVNIGEMVGEHLLTSSDVYRALNEERFQLELRQLIEGRVTSILKKDLGPVGSIVPERFRSHFLAGVKIIRWRFLKHLHCHLASAPVLKQLAATVAGHLEQFLRQPLGTRISREDLGSLVVFLEKSAARLLAAPEVEEWIHKQVTEWLHGLREEERGLGDLLPEEFTALILNRVEEAAPVLLEKVALLLQEPATQKRIADGLAAAVGNFASSLGPMAALLGNFLNPETIAEKILSYLQDKGDDIRRFLLDETVRKQTAAFLHDQARSFLSKPFGTLLSKVDVKTQDEIAASLSGQIAVMIKNPATAATLAELFRGEITKWSDRPVGEILAELFGEERLQNGRQWAGNELVAVIRSSGVKRMLDNLVTGLVEEKLLTTPIGPLADFLPKAVVEGIDDVLFQQVSDILAREVPGLVESLRIKDMVTQKVNTLDLLHLEQLLLSIMQEQFKYINMFGALLGFLIGGANLFLLRLG